MLKYNYRDSKDIILNSKNMPICLKLCSAKNRRALLFGNYDGLESLTSVCTICRTLCAYEQYERTNRCCNCDNNIKIVCRYCRERI